MLKDSGPDEGDEQDGAALGQPAGSWRREVCQSATVQ